MQLLVVLAHPSPDSFCAAIAREVVAAGKAAGHAVDLWDLQAEGFDPVMTAADWHDYRTGTGGNATDLARLAAAEVLILIYPTWWGGPPALLKGWFDRLWRPGVAFHLDQLALRPGLTRLRHLGVVTPHGGPRWAAWLTGQPGRRMVMRGLRVCAPKRCRTFWLAMYRAEDGSDLHRAAFLARVRRRMMTLR